MSADQRATQLMGLLEGSLDEPARVALLATLSDEERQTLRALEDVRRFADQLPHPTLEPSRRAALMTLAREATAAKAPSVWATLMDALSGFAQGPLPAAAGALVLGFGALFLSQRVFKDEPMPIKSTASAPLMADVSVVAPAPKTTVADQRSSPAPAPELMKGGVGTNSAPEGVAAEPAPIPAAKAPSKEKGEALKLSDDVDTPSAEMKDEAKGDMKPPRASKRKRKASRARRVKAPSAKKKSDKKRLEAKQASQPKPSASPAAVVSQGAVKREEIDPSPVAQPFPSNALGAAVAPEPMVGGEPAPAVAEAEAALSGAAAGMAPAPAIPEAAPKATAPSARAEKRGEDPPTEAMKRASDDRNAARDMAVAEGEPEADGDRAALELEAAEQALRRGQAQSAWALFDAFVRAHPQHPRVDEARFKAGRAAEALGWRAVAVAAYQAVRAGSWAREARARLNALQSPR